jgi:hypothetical protein
MLHYPQKKRYASCVSLHGILSRYSTVQRSVVVAAVSHMIPFCCATAWKRKGHGAAALPRPYLALARCHRNLGTNAVITCRDIPWSLPALLLPFLNYRPKRRAGIPIERSAS